MPKKKIEPVEILDIIESLFFGNTFRELSMDQIATELHMKKASLYYYFPSKEAMFLAVLQRSYEKYATHMREALQGDLKQAIPETIAFAESTKNLFAVVSQKGYCSNSNLRAVIQSYVQTLRLELTNILTDRFGWPVLRATLLLVLLDTYSKEYCMAGCKNSFDPAITLEIQTLFSF